MEVESSRAVDMYTGALVALAVLYRVLHLRRY
jgi:hypothetical protein